jgi:hypothetical protein
VLRCFAPARFVAMPHRARPRLRCEGIHHRLCHPAHLMAHLDRFTRTERQLMDGW